ncbi:DUF2312 domain-containing protein [Sphingopyxis sp. GW247-27LB]|uniref:DUF2312 domain-containing protein n=1 Tax=Sphingopyxis sp. GW247-27LB TaxID=2012632 RepID=UPI000BA53D33|nr:DUF2312 domain-containing protein [Sphingopyxis sp. GW247-27LB]PAL23556.1 DUF2312 domain-containing protein [Sphingopyxis sp. GW247-27LB]
MDDEDEIAGEGHNGSADAQLRQYIERVERLEEERKGVSDDIRDVYNEAKSQGYDPKIMRQIVRDRKKNVADVKEFRAVYEVYASALGLDHLIG